MANMEGRVGELVGTSTMISLKQAFIITSTVSNSVTEAISSMRWKSNTYNELILRLVIENSYVPSKNSFPYSV
jgi:hypothetical protein